MGVSAVFCGLSCIREISRQGRRACNACGLIYQSVPSSISLTPSQIKRETRMDRLFANGTVNAAVSGNGPAMFLLHSLLSDRASFASIEPELMRSHRVIVPELPGFGGSKAVEGGLAAVADRMAQVVSEVDDREAIVLGNGYGGFVALQMAIRHPSIANKLILAD